MLETEAQSATTARRGWFSPGAAAVLGTVIVPLVLTALFNSYGTPDAEAYVRMAFAQVAAATIAIGTATGVVVERVAHRAPIADVGAFGLIAVTIIIWQASSISRAADFLLNGLGLA